MKRSYPIGVLILEPSKEAAEALVNGLRLGGMRLRPRWVNRPGMLAEFLRGQSWELLLAGLDAPVVPPKQVVEIVRRNDCDLALIGIDHGSASKEAAVDALRAGFHDVVPLKPAYAFEHTVSRELESLDQRRRARRLGTALQASTRTLRELIHRSDRAVVFVHGGQILQANHAWMELMAIPAGEDPRGRPFSDYVAEEDRQEFSMMLAEQGHAPTAMVEIELNGLRADGEFVLLHMEFTPATLEERAGLLVTVRESAPQVVPARPVEPAAIDSKTTLVNAVSAALRAGTPGVLACILVDNQAKLDQVLGLRGRERLTKELEKRIGENAPDTAVIVQVSDDSYGVLLTGDNEKKLAEQAREIAGIVARNVIQIDEHTIRPACLTGVATLSASKGLEAMSVLEAAYDACRRPVVAEPEDFAASPDKGEDFDPEAIAEDLLAGMSDGRLRFSYQPIVRLHGEPIELYEVFIRLSDRHGAVVPTRNVISAARQTDLNGKLDVWVIQHAIGILAERQSQGRNTHLFIKLSDQCMDDIEIPLTITRELKARNVPPENFIIELSETAASGNLKKSNAFVQSLKKIGCPAALDYFGLSLSAFQLLEDVPAAYLKLDASLINRLAEDEEAYHQVAEICRRARALDKHTIASYLDNPQSLPKLYEAGVEFAQGYYIQEPSESMDYEFSILVG